MKGTRLILGIGELLWDLLSDRPDCDQISSLGTSTGTLGGAPANFTVMSGRLGNHAVILSRIGHDDLGRQAIERLEPLPVDTSCIEVDPMYQTGRVTVSILEGEPRYTIHQPSAWDFLQPTDQWIQLAERADAICFGSLAQRSQISRQTIQTVVAQTSSNCVRVFDVNLRAPFYSTEVIEESLELATVVKMNESEVPRILTLLGLSSSDKFEGHSLRAAAAHLHEEFPNLDLIVITRGDRGSLLVRKDEWHDHPGIPVQVSDSIGAGDAFTAAMTHYLLRGADLATLNQAGNRWGAWVASQAGAMPDLSADLRAGIIASIER